MKTLKYIPIVSGAMLLITCNEDQVATRAYPVLDTHAVTGVSPNGATLHAEILDAGFSGIEDHGFVYDLHDGPTMGNSEFVSLGERPDKGSFAALADRNLRKDRIYYVRAYATPKEGDVIVYGQVVAFESLGCAAPAITGISPAEGVKGEVLIVDGFGFSGLPENNVVRIGGERAECVTAGPYQLTCVIPSGLEPGEHVVTLDLGDFRIEAATKFTLKEG